MRLRSTAPVIWPDRAALDAWWLGVLADLDKVTLEPDRTLRFPADDQPGFTMRLTRGEHLRTGAVYAAEAKSIEGADAWIRIEGPANRRTVNIEVHGKRRFFGIGTSSLGEAVVDGLDAFDGVSVTSTHPYLGGALRLAPDPDRPLRLTLRLRWLQVEFLAAVRPAADVEDASAELVCDFEASARGLWTPAVAPILAVIGKVMPGEVKKYTRFLADFLTAVAQGREPSLDVMSVRESELRGVRETMRARLEHVQDVIDTRWWGRRGPGAWRREYAKLPPVEWPDSDFGMPTWAEHEEMSADTIARDWNGQRRDAIERALPHNHYADAPVDPPVTEPGVITDLELRWLRSPLSAYHYLRLAERQAAATTPDGPAPAQASGVELRP